MGILVEGFLELLEYFLRSTDAEFQAKTYIQREGIGIESAVTPVLSDILLRRCDKAIKRTLSEEGINL